MAFATTAGIGTPISPAFSIMLIVSLAMKAMIAVSLMNVEPVTRSRRQATSTTRRVVPLRQRPFQPARLSRAPSVDFWDL